ncbi:P-loop NTPase domain-containing protein LPA1 isoform X1 [Amborella trichopoda]|uniref:Uncharacterized protein n=1 Tax=Amborella trichopoda TaxID=13333 RepID=W1NH87_AMBTC|nr:P-loop NTPase domain-containing protein LPA1 isoform X1 [Amborella trichopoda]ERM94831.1 hypothetical protein AMTR_s00009p00066600 [Amborella trichopoda]|eukprot:XP_006827415.1 P-loop NTPase domain-containing protein LPA1 isoform X1 [Amborella trichopoda]
MADVPKLLYIVVDDGIQESVGGERKDAKANKPYRYTRSVLQSTLQSMGCKARHAFKISKRVFEIMRSEFSSNNLFSDKEDILRASDSERSSCEGFSTRSSTGPAEVDEPLIRKQADKINNLPFELYKSRTTVVVSRETFLDVVCDALSEYKYVGPNQRADLVLACRVRERKESVTILLCGTSGCGKSTLSALLGSRLGITTVISTDSIRHMMRSFVDEKENPLLWASTYHAGECLDPMAVAKAKAKRKAKKMAGVSPSLSKEEISDGSANKKSESKSTDTAGGIEPIGPKQMAIEGFKAQSEMVIDSLDRLITAWEERNESVVVEGVHLSLNFVMGLMRKHPSIIPFMIYITNEEKHMERFAVRAKYMTLDPAKNKYVKYIRNIRTIQDYLCNRADKHLVPKINNTNVDKSVAAIHATVFSCLRRREAGEQLYDPITNTVSLIHEEYRNKCAANSLSSKGMFQLIQRKGSSRHLMALLNTDGSVAKAWPVESGDEKGNGSEKGVGNPMYGPLLIGKAEPVNLQFGNFGISAWPNDTGGTSHVGSVDESRGDGTETGSRYYSSCCSSPRFSDGPAKELKEEITVSGSEEEADEAADAYTDEDLSDVDDKEMHEEMEGSVDEQSTKSDEEYDDLAIHEGQENEFWSEKADSNGNCNLENETKEGSNGDDELVDKYTQNLEYFLRTSEPLTEPSCCYSSLLSEQNTRSMPAEVKVSENGSPIITPRIHSRSLSIPAFGKYGSVHNGLILSGAPQR